MAFKKQWLRLPSLARKENGEASQRSSITIKGTRDGVSIVLGEGEWGALLDELTERLQTTSSFFKGAKVTLEVGERVLGEAELRELERILGECDMGLYLVSAQSADTRAAARVLDVRAVSGEPLLVEATSPDQPLGDGLLVHRTIRSGQVVQHPGHVVILGDVNPGSEVIAGGDVVVWGRLRGVVHAGAAGNDHAVVCALQMRPTQLRIGNYIARAPEELKKRRTSVPEIAFVGSEGIVAEPWDAEPKAAALTGET